MTTTRDEIRGWLSAERATGATHMIVVCDTFDHEDYPVFVKPDENVREVEARFNGKNMQRVIEVYNLGLPIDPQLSAGRCFNY